MSDNWTCIEHSNKWQIFEYVSETWTCCRTLKQVTTTLNMSDIWTCVLHSNMWQTLKHVSDFRTCVGHLNMGWTLTVVLSVSRIHKNVSDSYKCSTLKRVSDTWTCAGHSNISRIHVCARKDSSADTKVGRLLKPVRLLMSVGYSLIKKQKCCNRRKPGMTV